MFLNLSNQLGPQSLIAAFGNQRYIDQANFVRALLHSQMAGCSAVKRDNLVDDIWVICRQKISLGLMLHLKELADAIFAPSQLPQIVAAAALIQSQQKIGIF